MQMTGIISSFQTAMRNPFGLDFEVHNKNIFITLGSGLNCLGYVDQLEHIIGIARIALGLLALATSTNIDHRKMAAGHIFRGILEMMGSFELYLFIIDAAFTIVNLAHKAMLPSTMNAAVNNAESAAGSFVDQVAENQKA